MLKKHSDRICTYFKVDYEPQLGTRLAEAGDTIYKEFSPPQFGLGAASNHVFSWPSERYFLALSFQSIAWQGLGLSHWADNREKHVKSIRTALDTLGVVKLKRIGFKVSAYLPLEMSHQELCDLMFGSFLAPADEWSDMWGDSVDPWLSLEGERNGLKYVTTVSPMNTQQIKSVFRQNKNLERFVEDKFLDTGVKDFQNRITANDCLFFDIDLSQTDVDVNVLDSLTRDSLTQAEQVAEWCVRRLRSQPAVGGK